MQSESRLQHLATQLKWRLTDSSTCVYMLGVDDDGRIVGIHTQELEESLNTLSRMCSIVGATIIDVDRQRISKRPELWAAEVSVGLLAGQDSIHDCSKSTEKRKSTKIAFVGASGSGKSTLVGVLGGAGALLDDGNGSIRLSCLRHRHEVISGRTSSVSVEFLPFSDAGKAIKFPVEDEISPTLSATQQAALLSAPRVAQLVDLAGDMRYQKTTFSTLTSWAAPDWVCVVTGLGFETESCISPTSFMNPENNKTLTNIEISANGDSKKIGSDVLQSNFDEKGSKIQSLKDEELEDNLALVMGLELPFFVVVTFNDRRPLSERLESVRRVLDAVEKTRVRLFGTESNRNALLSCSSKSNVPTRPVFIPSVMCVSSVSGEGIENLIRHIGRLVPRRNVRMMSHLRDHFASPIFCIEVIQEDVPDAGVVIGGTLLRGFFSLDSHRRTSVDISSFSDTPDSSNNLEESKKAKLNQNLVLKSALKTRHPSLAIGPLSDGSFIDVLIKSIHRMRLPTRSACPGDMVTFAIDCHDSSLIQKGMLAVSPLPHSPMNNTGRYDHYSSMIHSNSSQPISDLKDPDNLINSEENNIAGLTLEEKGRVNCSKLMVEEFEAEVVTNHPTVDSDFTTPINGILYWMGSRLPCTLSCLHKFYRDTRMRAAFRLLDGNRAYPLPGSRVIFTSTSLTPPLRLQGFLCIPIDLET